MIRQGEQAPRLNDALAARIRADFPLLATTVGDRPLSYLDNAASLQMPRPVMEALRDFRTSSYANVHRGVHALSAAATEAFDEARRSAAAFIGAAEQEVVFTSGTTDAVNKAAAMLAPRVGRRDNVVITALEHHSNVLPWRRLAQLTGCSLRVAPLDGRGGLDAGAFCRLVDERTRVVSLTQLSNVTGIAVDVPALAPLLRERTDGAIIVDGAQGVVHRRSAVSSLGCDLYAFSGHKLGAPTGTGVLWARGSLLRQLEPAVLGGGTVTEVTENAFRLSDTVERFEPGTPNIDGAVGLAAALRYWERYDEHACHDHKTALLARLEQGLASVAGVRVLGSADERAGCLAFAVEAGSSYDWAKIADGLGVAVRSGHHCAQPYLRALGCDDAVRVSVAPYNTSSDVDRALEAFRAASGILRGGGIRGRARRRR